MVDTNELTYAAIITIELPGMSHPATVTVSLRPPDRLETAPGHLKALRDCTLADLQAFADAMEEKLWSEYKASALSDLAGDDLSGLKITILNDDGEALALRKEDVLGHAIVSQEAPPEGPGESALQQAPDKDVVEDEDEPETGSAGSVETNERAVATPAPAAETATEPLPAAPDAAPEEGPGEGQEKAQADESEAGTRHSEPLSEEVVESGTVAPAAEEEVSEKALDKQSEAPVEAITREDAAQAVSELPRPAELRIAGLRRPLGHRTKAAVDILINEPAFRDAQAHALSSLDREVAGVLIGPQPEKQPDGRYVVHVTDTIIARHTRMQGASVTYTPESWRYVTDKLGERYPDEEAVIVGWYHTHPGFGIFLSGMDLFIHKHFFTQTWHVALVLDPLTKRSGFFCWDRAQAEVARYDFPWPEWAQDSW